MYNIFVYAYMHTHFQAIFMRKTCYVYIRLHKHISPNHFDDFRSPCSVLSERMICLGIFADETCELGSGHRYFDNAETGLKEKPLEIFSGTCIYIYIFVFT